MHRLKIFLLLNFVYCFIEIARIFLFICTDRVDISVSLTWEDEDAACISSRRHVDGLRYGWSTGEVGKCV